MDLPLSTQTTSFLTPLEPIFLERKTHCPYRRFRSSASDFFHSICRQCTRSNRNLVPLSTPLRYVPFGVPLEQESEKTLIKYKLMKSAMTSSRSCLADFFENDIHMAGTATMAKKHPLIRYTSIAFKLMQQLFSPPSTATVSLSHGTELSCV